MKIAKKLIFIFILSLFFMSLVPAKAANKDSATDPTGVSTYTPTESTVRDIYGMTHTLAKATTTTKGTTKGQLINVFEMKTDGITSKLVTWAVQKDNTSYTRADIIEAAEDYEAKHPGWIVTGGINADQYFFKYGNKLGADGSAMIEPSPYYPMISDGDKLFTINPYNNSSNVVGFKNDGSVNSFAYPDGNLGGYQLSIIDELGNELSSFVVNGINRNAVGAETTVWCAPIHTSYSDRAQNKSINTTNQLYLVENADLALVSIDPSYGYPTGGLVSLFCKGTISNSELKEYTIAKGQFAIETTDENVISALNNGVKVKVELLFGSEELNAVDEAMGYHSVHMLNGSVQPNNANDAYNTKSYSRALMGKKADGTYVLITGDYVMGAGSYGLTFTECNAVANYYDCTDLYQMDGGGSVTALARQDNGTFKVTNYPKDSGNPNSPRENLSYLFFVKRDPGVLQNQQLSTHYSVTLDKKELLGAAKVENLKVILDNKEYEFGADAQLTIDGLDQNTQYKLKLTYDIVENNKTISDYTYIYVQTKEYIYPNEIIKVAEVTDTTIKIVKTQKDYAQNISNIILKVGHKTYNMGNQDEYICTDLYKDVDYEVSCTYDIYDPASTVTFNGQTEPIIVHTKAFKDPTIEKFIENKKGSSYLTIEYEYNDEDDVVSKAYITINDEIAKEVLLKSDSVRLTGLDFEENDYIIKLVIEYLSEKEETIKVESEPLEYIREAIHEHNFVEGKCECGEIDPNYEPPHVHNFVEGKCECGEIDPNYEPPHTHNFVEGKCECGEVDPNYEPPHVHNFVEGKCECGEVDPNYEPPHVHNFVEGKCECGETDPNYEPPHEHNFKDGKCECGETDPNYVAPKKKCGKKSAELLIVTLAAASVIGVFFRKRK